MSKYRKLPVEVEAIQYIGDNYLEICDFAKKILPSLPSKNADILIETLEGTMNAKVGHYIIKGVNGEIYPCKPDIFEKTYEKVEDLCKLEEAIERLKLCSNNECNICGRYEKEECMLERNRCEKTVLQALDNSIPIQEVEELVKEYKEKQYK